MWFKSNWCQQKSDFTHAALYIINMNSNNAFVTVIAEARTEPHSFNSLFNMLYSKDIHCVPVRRAQLGT